MCIRMRKSVKQGGRYEKPNPELGSRDLSVTWRSGMRFQTFAFRCN